VRAQQEISRMKRIALSLFAIIAIISVGVFATGAYFTDSISATNYTFTTGSADLKFNFCGDGEHLNIDCSTTSATLDSVNFTTAQTIGPGIENDGCLVIQNTGQYTLNLKASLTVTSDPAGMWNAFQVYSAITNDHCNPGVISSTPFPWESAHTAQGAGAVSIGSLAPGARMYVIQSNGWDSTGDQNSMQNQTIKMNTLISGQTV
jgi:hypothetical protein